MEHVIETDVLVVGGGIAGSFAAVKAREQGVDVTLVSKGYIGRSGQTPWAHATAVFNPDWGHKLEEWVGQANRRGLYVNNRDWTETILKDSYARYKDLADWGVVFLKDNKGEFIKESMPGEAGQALMWSLHDGSFGRWVKPLRSKPLAVGVHIYEGIMIAELLKQDGQIVGAIGFSNEGNDLYIFKAKATVLCCGAGGFRPWGGWPISDLTSDGHIMAYKAGAEISGKEFEDFHGRRAKLMKRGIAPQMRATVIDAEGQEVKDFAMGFSNDLAAHAGKAPLKRGGEENVSNTALGMSIHTIEGVWPVDKTCFSGVPGLWVAGDNASTWVVGALYAGMGFASATCTSTGARAGTAAAEYAKKSEKPVVDSQELKRSMAAVLMPFERHGGFSPAWVTQLLQNLMMPYFILRIKKEERLKAALTSVEFMRDHLAPKLFARDFHGLRLAHETKNMVINAEMRLRASLFRTESRGTHYREDYPQQDNAEWLAWVMLKEEDGRMKLYKKPIPEEWRPDLTKLPEGR
jgi:succinate dehydrogenase/fumarate reductase flavoprotein subunit